VAGVAKGWRDFLGNWQDAHAEAADYRELDGERVLVLFRMHGRGKTSGLELGELRAMAAHVFHIRARKVTSITLYLDGERAFAKFGLASLPDAAQPPA
jgi:hypothetical protein